MTGDELRAQQAPLKERYKADPESAKAVLHARAKLGEGSITVTVETAPAPGGSMLAGLDPATGGGEGPAARPHDMLLQALVACAGVTMRSVSTVMGLNVQGHVVAEGDIDFRGTMGVSREVPVGISAIRLRFELTSDATDEQLTKLVQLTERYCVVLQTLRAAVPATSTFARV